VFYTIRVKGMHKNTDTTSPAIESRTKPAGRWKLFPCDRLYVPDKLFATFMLLPLLKVLRGVCFNC
jgi:hypothetical protein